MIKIKSKLPTDDISIFAKISKLSREHEATNLGQGFPDFEVSVALKDRVSFYLSNHKDQYAPMPGVPELRKALSKKYNNNYPTPLDADEHISITAGATQGIFCCIQATVHQGDEVIIIDPSYDSYGPSIKAAGGTVVPLKLKQDFSIDWDLIGSKVTDNTKMIVVNNPHNPTGQIWNEEDFLALSQIVKNTDILILSDEVYEHLVYDGATHLSILNYPELFKRSFCTFSFGKTFHATGWKMGYVIAPTALTKAFRSIHQWNVFSVNSFLQYAIADHLSDSENYTYLNGFYQKKRDFFINEMGKTRFKKIDSSGTYFQLYDYSEISDLEDVKFAEWLIKEHGIASIPISPFCAAKTDWKVVRFCFAKKESTLLEAGKKLEQV
jgi:methionine aminotransferase